MIFGQDREELRQMYVDAWRKFVNSEVLSPLEAQIASVVEDHPEYQAILEQASLDADFEPEGGQTNPFLQIEGKIGELGQLIDGTTRRFNPIFGNPFGSAHGRVFFSGDGRSEGARKSGGGGRRGTFEPPWTSRSRLGSAAASRTQ